MNSRRQYGKHTITFNYYLIVMATVLHVAVLYILVFRAGKKCPLGQIDFLARHLPDGQGPMQVMSANLIKANKRLISEDLSRASKMPELLVQRASWNSSLFLRALILQ